MGLSDLCSKGGARGAVGIHIGVIREEPVKTLIILSLGALVCQVQLVVRLVIK